MKIKISELQRSLPDNVVTRIYWLAEDGDENHTVSVSGTIDLPSKSPADPSFIAFESLTEQQAYDWCVSALGQNAINAIQTKLNALIASKNAPLSAVGFPWPEQVNQPV
jgi:hypothetical protein